MAATGTTGSPVAAAGIYAGEIGSGATPSATNEGLMGTVDPNGTVLIIPGIDGAGSVETTVPILVSGIEQTPTTVPAFLDINNTVADASDYSVMGSRSLPQFQDLMLDFSPTLNAIPPPQRLAGTFQGEYVGTGIGVAFVLGGHGNFIGSGSNGCHIDGSITPVENMNELEVNAYLYGPAACSGSFYGIAFLSSTSTPRGPGHRRR